MECIDWFPLRLHYASCSRTSLACESPALIVAYATIRLPSALPNTPGSLNAGVLPAIGVLLDCALIHPVRKGESSRVGEYSSLEDLYQHRAWDALPREGLHIAVTILTVFSMHRRCLSAAPTGKAGGSDRETATNFRHRCDRHIPPSFDEGCGRGCPATIISAVGRVCSGISLPPLLTPLLRRGTGTARLVAVLYARDSGCEHPYLP